PIDNTAEEPQASIARIISNNQMFLATARAMVDIMNTIMEAKYTLRLANSSDQKLTKDTIQHSIIADCD
ncbi:29317_t:CDS:2, partial [Racocetra persica]